MMETTTTITTPTSNDDFDVDDLTEDASPVRCSFICGAAGTGKTFGIKKLIEDDPKAGTLCATTGIAGVNLNATTINSLLKFYDTESMQDAFVNGRLIRQLARIGSEGYKELFVDEVSMFDADKLDILYQATMEANRYKKVRKVNESGLGLTLVGDFAQLPPIKAPFAFKAECWSEFDQHTTRLTKQWRQVEGSRFLDAVSLVRAGKGLEGAMILKDERVDFAASNAIDFPGTTILPKNDEVDRYNWLRLKRVEGKSFSAESKRWNMRDGEPGEWRLIPQRLQLKLNSYVMILSNDAPAFRYANGDCGYVVDYGGKESAEFISIKLVRTEQVVNVPMIERRLNVADEPFGIDVTTTYSKADYASGRKRPWGKCYYDETAKRYVVGAVQYFPIRLGYSCTVHKSQGLTLDNVQIDATHPFFGSPHMAYVALSRCRSSQGLRIVGTPQVFAKRVKVSQEVIPWL